MAHRGHRCSAAGRGRTLEGLRESARNESPWKTCDEQQAVEQISHHGDQAQKLEGPSSREQNEHLTRWVRVDDVHRFVMVRSGGEYRWRLRGGPGSSEQFDRLSRGRLISRWRWVQKTKSSAVLLVEFGPERCSSVGTTGTKSPIHQALWSVGHSIAPPTKKCPEGAARILGDAETREERELLKDPKTKDSCVYLSLFHLARRRTTKDWLKLIPEWGKADDAKIEELARVWVAMEDRSLHWSEVRMKSSTSTAASSVLIKQFVPMGSDGVNRDTILVHRASPHGAQPVKGHCVPIAGDDETQEFGWPREMAFVGVPPEWTAVVVPKVGKAKIDLSKLPKEKGKQKWVPVDQMTMDALDEALSKSAPNKKDEASSSHVVADGELAKELEAAVIAPLKPLAVEVPKREMADKAMSPACVIDGGTDPFESEEVDVHEFSGSRYDNLFDRFIFEGPTSSPPFPHFWRAGYWADPGHEFGCTDWADRWVKAPSMCTATIDMVKEWGTRTLYVEPREEGGIRIVRAGVITDGLNVAECFREGSLIKIKGLTYEARAERWRIHGQVYKLLRLVRISSGSIRSTFGVWRFTGTARLLSYDPRVRDLSHKELMTCKWQAEAKTQQDIIATGFVNIVRAEQVAKKVPLDPDRIVPALRVLAKSFEKPRDVAGPYTWGHCYSGCGAERPGKFKGRVCPECSKKNTTLGSWAAAGMDICNPLNPVRYPGVVHLRKKHPELKKGAKTIAKYGVDVGVYDKNGDLVPMDDVLRFALKSAPGARLGGIGLDGYRPFATAVGPRPLLEAILYRVFKDLGVRKVDKNAFYTATGLLDEILPIMLKGAVEVGTDEFERMLTWAQSMKNARRRRALLQELYALRDNGFVIPKGWDKIKPFVKTEHLPELSVAHDWVRGDEAVGGIDYTALEDVADDLPESEDEDDAEEVDGDEAGPRVRYVARLIQAPSDYSHLMAGPILKPMIPLLKSDWGVENWIFYASVTPEKLDHWLDRVKNARSWFWSDYSAFDSTYSAEAWDMLEGIYARICPDAPDMFWKVLEQWRTPNGEVPVRSSGPLGWKLKYQARTCNASGRDDTALANALLNGIVLAMSFAAALAGVDVTMVTAADLRRASDLVNIAIVGDDSLVACEFNIDLYRSQIEANIRRFGLIATVNSSDHLYDVTFLGQMPYPVGRNEYQWGPTLGRRLYKAFWQLDCDGGLPSWTRGVAQQLALFRNVPILREMAEQVDWLLTGHSVTKQALDPNRIWAARTAATRNYTDEVFDWVCKRYEAVGVTASMIREDIRRIRTVVRLPAVIRLDSVSRMLAMDDL